LFNHGSFRGVGIEDWGLGKVGPPLGIRGNGDWGKKMDYGLWTIDN